MEEMFTLQDLSDVLKIGPKSVSYRMKMLGINKNGKSGKVVYLNKDEYDAIVGYKKKENKRDYDSAFYSRKKIYIIEYFLTNKRNSTIEIASALDTTEHFVHRVLNEYLKNSCQILVRSKEI